MMAKLQIQRGRFCAGLHAEFGMIERTAQNDMRAATALGAKTELISDLPQTAFDMLRAPPTQTCFCNLDWLVALVTAACDPERTFATSSQGRDG